MTDVSEIPTPVEEAAKPEEAGPRILGHFPPEAMEQVRNMRMLAQQHVLQLGQLELQKAQLIAEVGELEQRIHQKMQAEARKIGVPENVAFNVTPVGVVYLLDAKAS